MAKGLNYLFSRNIIHRDLSARNCLVFENATSNILNNGQPNIIVKISDFGLAKMYFVKMKVIFESFFIV